MDLLWQSGIAFIIWLQGLGSWLEFPMKMFSLLGTEEFFFLFLPIVYWGIDAAAGLQLGAILLLSGGANDILKLAFHGPRPYWFSSQVKALAAETSFGAPSAHAQIAVSLWGMVAILLKRQWAWAVAIFIIFMIGVSRLYLAVHFPHDVLLGWMLGALGLWFFFHLWDPIAAWAKNKSLGQQIGLAFALSMAVLVVGVIAFGSVRTWVMPDNWMENIWQSRLTILPAPLSLDNTIASSAVLFGMLAGVAWINLRGGFVSDGKLWQRVVRIFIGFVGILVFYLGLKAIFPRGNELVPYLLRYLRFALIGGWMTAGAPWLFLKLKLVGKHPQFNVP